MRYHVIGAKVVSDYEDNRAQLCHFEVEAAQLVEALAEAWAQGYGNTDDVYVIRGEEVDVEPLQAEVLSVLNERDTRRRADEAAAKEQRERAEYERLKEKFQPAAPPEGLGEGGRGR